MKSILITTGLLIILVVGIVGAQANTNSYEARCYGPLGMMGGYGAQGVFASGFLTVFAWIFWAAFFIALVLLIAWLFKQVRVKENRRKK